MHTEHTLGWCVPGNSKHPIWTKLLTSSKCSDLLKLDLYIQCIKRVIKQARILEFKSFINMDQKKKTFTSGCTWVNTSLGGYKRSVLSQHPCRHRLHCPSSTLPRVTLPAQQTQAANTSVDWDPQLLFIDIYWFDGLSLGLVYLLIQTLKTGPKTYVVLSLSYSNINNGTVHV